MLDVPWGELIPFLAFGVVVADASVAIRGDMSGFHRDLKGAETETKTLGGRLKDALSPRNIMGAAGALGLVLGVRQVLRVAGDAAGAFKELQQTQRTTDEVFGKSASVIEDWAQRSAKAAGMSQQTVFQSASVMGQTLQNMGFSAEEAAEKTVMLQQRAAEMAIAFGQTPERAILAITAAMRGERDTIEKFGVSIKQADVNARVMALGLDTSTASAKKTAEAMAILDLVMEQTSNQAGRFAESQDDAAVKMAVAQARIDDFMATSFGPMVTSIQVGAVDVATAFADMSEGVGEFFDETFGEENNRKVQRLADTLGITFSEASNMVREAMADTGQSWDSSVDDMLASAQRLRAGTTTEYDNIVAATDAAYAAAAAIAAEKAEDIAGSIPEAVRENWQRIRQAGIDTQLAYNAGIFDTQGAFLAEIDGLLKALDEGLAPGEEIALLRGKKVALMTARGINEGNPAAQAAIDLMIDQINSRLNTLNGYQYGANVARTIASGMYAEAWQVGQAAGYLATKVRGQLQIRSEPPDASSPLRGITQWGPNIVKTIAGGIFDNLGTGSAAAGALAGALVPSLPGGGFASAGAPATAMGGNTYVLNVNGVQREYDNARAAFEALLEMGAFTEGRLS